METQITVNCRLEELEPNQQVSIIRLINHLASAGSAYREDAFARIEKISSENSLTHFCGSNVEEGGETQVTVRWAFRYDCDKVVTLKEGDDIEAMIEESDFECPDFEETECTEAYIWQITDDETGEELYAV